METVNLEMAYAVPMSHPALVDRVVDGDTVVLNMDVGFDLTIKAKCRLARINAPEMNTPQGVEAKMRLREMVEQAGNFTAEILGRDKYGRWLLNLKESSGVCLNDILVKEGFAVYV